MNKYEKALDMACLLLGDLDCEDCFARCPLWENGCFYNCRGDDWKAWKEYFLRKVQEND